MYEHGSSATLGGGGLAARVVELDRQRRALEAQIVATVGEAERSGEHRADGHTTVAAWLRCLVGCSPEQASGWRQAGRLIHACPDVERALAGGVLGVEQVQVLARAFADPRCGATLVESVPTFLVHAPGLGFTEFRAMARRWEALADSDGAHCDADAAHDRRTAWIVESGGGWQFGGSCGAVQGAILRELWDRFAEVEQRADWDAAHAEHGPDATPEHLPRTGGQRRVDALIELATVAASTPAGAQRPEPLVNLVVDVGTVEQLLDDGDGAVGPAGQRQAPADPWWRRCATLDGTVVPARDVVGAMLVGQVRRVVTEGAGVIVDFGRRRRMFSGAAREAVLLASSRCCWAGCERAVSQCQADHTIEWQHAGPTSVSNAGPLCRWHNVFKSRNGYRTWRDPTGRWHTYRPNGTEITAPEAA